MDTHGQLGGRIACRQAPTGRIGDLGADKKGRVAALRVTYVWIGEPSLRRIHRTQLITAELLDMLGDQLAVIVLPGVEVGAVEI